MNVDSGTCVICKIGGDSTKNLICSNCGNPAKIIATCMKCHSRVDLTEKSQEEIVGFLGEEVSFGTAIAMPWCHNCTPNKKEQKGQAILYKIRPKAKA